jgi:hypothetical protein
MRRATAFAALALVPIVLAGLPLLAWLAYTVLAPGGSSAAPMAADGLTCTVRATACVGSEVEVFRMSNTTNAHAGTPLGAPGYTYRVCCEADGLGSDCSGTYATVLALSGTSNAHVATSVGGAYTTQVCLSVTEGTVDCSYGPDCGGDECVATVSGASNAHVADCDGGAPYTTKVCCEASAQDCSAGVDTDGDGFDNDVECYLPTDPGDACPDWKGTPGLCPGASCDGHDAWPLDNNVDKASTVVGDVLIYVGKTGQPVGGDPLLQRLDINADGAVTVVGDVLAYPGNTGIGC